MSDSNSNKQFRSSDLNLELMSTDELKELLRLDAHLSGSNTLNNEFVFHVLEVIEYREKKHPTGIIPDVDVSWTSFQKNYMPTVDDGYSLYEDDEDHLTSSISSEKSSKSFVLSSHKRYRIHRIILVAAVFMILSGTLVAQAVGIDLFGALARWTAETFHFETGTFTDEIKDNQPPAATNANLEYTSLSEAVVALGIKEKVVPNWWPNGFELIELKTSSTPLGTTIYSLYKSDEKSFTVSIRIYSSTDGIAANTFEKDGENVVQYEQGGILHYIMSNIDDNCVIWTDNLLLCTISGDITVNNLKEMVASIY